ncbi:cell division protein FtsL [Seminibacterium arietis]|uniref:Cell division protein FtsL n=1 Tax=Seminibacterium arietis TaxID=1173502 RepID=A0ABW3I6S3_9PAST
MLEGSERYPLRNIILEDLFVANKLPILLLIAVVVTALGTIWLTNSTRVLVSEKNDLVLQYQALENEFRNLQLEEITQSDNTRIEAIATGKLQMKKIAPEQEVLILE